MLSAPESDMADRILDRDRRKEGFERQMQEIRGRHAPTLTAHDFATRTHDPDPSEKQAGPLVTTKHMFASKQQQAKSAPHEESHCLLNRIES